jgi:hypothetical protein
MYMMMEIIIGVLFSTKKYQELLLTTVSYNSMGSDVVAEPIVPVKIASMSLSICS